VLTRKAWRRFEQWGGSRSGTALLVTGARQVGKTYLVREFARARYPRLVEFNLIDDRAARDSFRQASSAEDLAFRLSVASGTPLVPGETLVFIDEVQECPEIVTWVKFLVDRGDYDYVLSGSLLGIALENVRSLPVGYVTEVQMFPLDFEEFCWANGVPDEAFARLRQHFADTEPVADHLHRRLLELWRRYLLVGGMPDAVAGFARAHSLDPVRTVQEDVRRFYRRDISQYAPRDRRLVIQNIYDLVPSELATQNRRFRLSSIADVRRFAQVEEEFLWLLRAGVALAAYNVREPVSPLLINESRSLFRLFYSDVGLLTGAFPKPVAQAILAGQPGANLGGVYENAVGQELAAHGFDLRYFTNRQVGELDFVLENRAGGVTALEVKSSRNYLSHKALDNALAVKNYDIQHAYVLAETNTERRGAVVYWPIYMVALLANE
jgi:predicted AAA+ superfamily ATPase